MSNIADDLAGLSTEIGALTPLPNNPRRGDVIAVQRSLAAFGQRKPIVVRRSDSVVIAGNHTLKAAQALGWDTIAAVFVDDDDATAKAYALADNRTAELGGYDDADLAAMIGEVHDLDHDLLDATGWTDDDLERLLAGLDTEPDGIGTGDGSDPEPTDPPADPITEPGDVWELGEHRLICGNARDADTVSTLLGRTRVNLAFTSPPYADARVYDEGSGFTPIPPDGYVEWFEAVQDVVADHLADDGSWFVNIKAKADGLDTPLYVFDLVTAHVRQWGWHFVTEFCWERTGMPKRVTRRFKNQFEPIYQFTRGPWKFRPGNVMHATSAAIAPQGPGAGDTNWADDLGNRGFDADRIGEGMAYPGNRLPPFAAESTGHTAAFPVGLPAWFMRAYTDPGDVVFDPFMGSGSTIIAGVNEDRIVYGVELSPAYCDVICRRFQTKTGIKPVRGGVAHDFGGG